MAKLYKGTYFLDRLELTQLKLIDGLDSIDKFGANPALASGTTKQDIWEQGGTYTFSSTDDIVSVSSSNVADTDILIEITGLLADGTEQIGYAKLNGQNIVNIYDNVNTTGDTISYWRVYRMQNVSGEKGVVSAKDIAGDVYCYVGTTQTLGVPTNATDIRAKIINGNNQTQMAIYTIPRGKTGFLYRGEVGISLAATFTGGNESVNLQYRSRRNMDNGESIELGVFKVKKTITLNTYGTSTYQDYRIAKDPIPELTDIIITATNVSEVGMGSWATLDIILIDSNLLT
jgi:hypothetical protein